MFFKETIQILLVFQVLSKVEPSLPPPNVRVESVNLRNVLHWSPVNETFPVEYAVQYFFDHLVGWKDVQSCTQTSALHCDFTSVARPSLTLTLRVRAQGGNQSSTWSMSKPFCAREQTHLGPPGVALLTRPGSLLVQMSDPSPELRAEYSSALKYKVFYWLQTNHQKKHLKSVSSTVTLESLKVGGNYCVEVQYVILKRAGNLSMPTCTVVPGSEEEKRTTLIVVVVVVVVLLGMLICACLINIHKNYDFLKKVLQPPIGLPDHIYRFFEIEEFSQPLDDKTSTSDLVSVTFVTEGEEEVSSSSYATSPQGLVGQFPTSSSLDLENDPSAPRNCQP